MERGVLGPFPFDFRLNMPNFQGILSWGFQDDYRKNRIFSVFTMYRNNFLRTENNKNKDNLQLCHSQFKKKKI